MTDSNTPPLANILEAVLMAAGDPVSLERMQSLFDEENVPSSKTLREALTQLKQDLLGRGVELVEVASGFRLQVRADVAPWVARLWEERPQRYSRALLETLALIAYRQPITRGDIEDVRGVVVSSNIMKTLLEREWVRVVGHRDVPGRPAMYATTKEFLDYFGIKNLEELPTLNEIRELDDANRKLELGEDAEARKEPDKDYDFQTEEEVAQRGADVLAATEDDLEKAKALVDKVESNVFAKSDDENGETADDSKQDLSGLLARLAAKREDNTPEASQEVDSNTEAEADLSIDDHAEPPSVLPQDDESNTEQHNAEPADELRAAAASLFAVSEAEEDVQEHQNAATDTEPKEEL